MVLAMVDVGHWFILQSTCQLCKGPCSYKERSGYRPERFGTCATYSATKTYSITQSDCFSN